MNIIKKMIINKVLTKDDKYNKMFFLIMNLFSHFERQLQS